MQIRLYSKQLEGSAYRTCSTWQIDYSQFNLIKRTETFSLFYGTVPSLSRSFEKKTWALVKYLPIEVGKKEDEVFQYSIRSNDK